MSFFEALTEKRATVSQSGGHPSTFLSWLGGDQSFSGVEVTESNSLTYTAVYGAVRVLAESVASLPLKMYRRRTDGGKDEATDHPTYPVVHNNANEETTSFIWRETLQGHLCTWGNGYSEIQRRATGQPKALYQRRPDRVEIDRNQRGEIEYRVEREYGGEDILTSDQMLHVPGLSFNGLIGFSPIRMARESIGLGLATERAGSAFFGNSSMPGGFVTHPGSLTPEAQDRVRNTIEKIHKGSSNAFRLAVLDEGMDWTQAGIPNEDAQFLETRTFQVQEVARWFRIPPHMLAELSHATFSNIEHLDIQFVKYTLMPWLKRWEAEMNRKLLTEQEKAAGYFFEFLVDAFLRGDTKTRYEAYGMGIKDGWMNRNEVRAKENMNPEEGLDDFLLPQQTGTVEDDEGDKGEGGEPVAEPTEEEPRSESRVLVSPEAERRSLESRWKLQEIFRELLEQSASRLVASEVKSIRQKIDLIPTEGSAAFRLWLEEFFIRHRSFSEQVMGPVLKAYMEAVSTEAVLEVDGEVEDFSDDVRTFAEEYIEAFGSRHSGGDQAQLFALLDEAQTDEAAAEAVLTRIGEWEEKSASKIAGNEATQASAAVSRMVYAGAGVGLLVWQANRDACPLCQDMHGRAVEITVPFLNKGDQVEGNEETPTLEVKQVRNHPPLHGGCLCSVSPG